MQNIINTLALINIDHEYKICFLIIYEYLKNEYFYNTIDLLIIKMYGTQNALK